MEELVHYCLTCAEPAVHALPATVWELAAKSVALGRLQGPRLPGEWWMIKRQRYTHTKKMGMDDRIYHLDIKRVIVFSFIPLRSGKQETGAML